MSPGPQSSRADYVGLAASSSIGLGHLTRVAGLRRLLPMPTRLMGRYDARLTDDGLKVRQRLMPELAPDAKVWVVDGGHLPRHVLHRRLVAPETRVVWIRRGLFREGQALIQAGYLDFVDLVVEPDEAIRQPPDAVSRLAEARGKLRRIGVCHAHQVAPAPEIEANARVYIGLGGYEKPQRDRFDRLRRRLEVKRIGFGWSSHTFLPALDGYPAPRRVPVARALSVKARARGAILEAGYNSVYEALYLGVPVLLVANEGRGREAQRARVRIAKAVSPLMFDEEDADDVEAWLEAIRTDVRRPRGDPGDGLFHLKTLIEEAFDSVPAA